MTIVIRLKVSNIDINTGCVLTLILDSYYVMLGQVLNIPTFSLQETRCFIVISLYPLLKQKQKRSLLCHVVINFFYGDYKRRHFYSRWRNAFRRSVQSCMVVREEGKQKGRDSSKGISSACWSKHPDAFRGEQTSGIVFLDVTEVTQHKTTLFDRIQHIPRGSLSSLHIYNSCNTRSTCSYRFPPVDITIMILIMSVRADKQLKRTNERPTFYRFRRFVTYSGVVVAFFYLSLVTI